MMFSRFALPLAFTLAAATTALAQEQTGESVPVDETPAPDAADGVPATDQTAEGIPVPPEAAGAPLPDADALDIQTFTDWELRCSTQTNECFMYQLLRDTNDNPVAEYTLIALPAGGEAAAGATVITPLGTLLSEGLIVGIDSAQPRQYAFNWCTRGGCFSRFGLTDSDVAAMKRGARGVVQIRSVASPEAPVQLELSLSGFTAAFDALSAQN